MQKAYQSLDDMIANAESIIEVRKTGKSEDIVDQNVDLTLTSVEVKKVIKGDEGLANQVIRIMDFRQTSMGIYDKEDHYVLFLYPKTGRLGDDIYTVVGVYQGKFKVKDNGKLSYDADQYGGYKTFQDELSDISIDTAAEKIKLKAKKSN